MIKILSPWLNNTAHDIKYNIFRRRTLIDDECFCSITKTWRCEAYVWFHNDELHCKYIAALSSISEAQIYADTILINEGFRLLNEEEYNKYQTLI